MGYYVDTKDGPSLLSGKYSGGHEVRSRFVSTTTECPAFYHPVISLRFSYKSLSSHTVYLPLNVIPGGAKVPWKKKAAS